jgi:hypothetical protein
MKSLLTFEIESGQVEYIKKLVRQYNMSLPSDTGFRGTMFEVLFRDFTLPPKLTILKVGRPKKAKRP